MTLTKLVSLPLVDSASKTHSIEFGNKGIFRLLMGLKEKTGNLSDHLKEMVTLFLSFSDNDLQTQSSFLLNRNKESVDPNHVEKALNLLRLGTVEVKEKARKMFQETHLESKPAESREQTLNTFLKLKTEKEILNAIQIITLSDLADLSSMRGASIQTAGWLDGYVKDMAKEYELTASQINKCCNDFRTSHRNQSIQILLFFSDTVSKFDLMFALLSDTEKVETLLSSFKPSLDKLEQFYRTSGIDKKIKNKIEKDNGKKDIKTKYNEVLNTHLNKISETEKKMYSEILETFLRGFMSIYIDLISENYDSSASSISYQTDGDPLELFCMRFNALLEARDKGDSQKIKYAKQQISHAVDHSIQGTLADLMTYEFYDCDQHFVVRAKEFLEKYDKVSSSVENEGSARALFESNLESKKILADFIVSRFDRKQKEKEEFFERLKLSSDHSDDEVTVSNKGTEYDRYLQRLEDRARSLRENKSRKESERLRRQETLKIQKQRVHENYLDLTSQIKTDILSGCLFDMKYADANTYIKELNNQISKYKEEPGVEQWKLSLKSMLKQIAKENVATATAERELKSILEISTQLRASKTVESKCGEANRFREALINFSTSDTVKVIVMELYRYKDSGNVYGDGGTADGLRFESQPPYVNLSPQGHYEKANYYYCYIEHVLRCHDLSKNDSAILNHCFDDLSTAIDVHLKSNKQRGLN